MEQTSPSSQQEILDPRFYEIRTACKGRVVYTPETGCWIFTGVCKDNKIQIIVERAPARRGSRILSSGRLPLLRKLFGLEIPEGYRGYNCIHSPRCVHPDHVRIEPWRAQTDMMTERFKAQRKAMDEAIFINYILPMGPQRAAPWSLQRRMKVNKTKAPGILARVDDARKEQYHIMMTRRRLRSPNSPYNTVRKHMAICLAMYRAWKRGSTSLGELIQRYGLEDIFATYLTNNARLCRTLTEVAEGIVSGELLGLLTLPIYPERGDPW